MRTHTSSTHFLKVFRSRGNTEWFRTKSLYLSFYLKLNSMFTQAFNNIKTNILMIYSIKHTHTQTKQQQHTHIQSLGLVLF